MNNLAKLRELMQQEKVDTYIITKFDPHQSEITHDMYNGVKFISGFTGSNGTVLITQEKAYLYTDARYYIQAKAEMKDGFELQKQEPGFVDFSEYAVTNTTYGTIGFDGITFNTEMVDSLISEKCDTTTLRYDINLLNKIWDNRPVFKREPIWHYPEQYSGESYESKLKKVRAELDQHGGDVYIISSLDDIAWLLNIRCMTPTISFNFYAYLAITKDKVILFMDQQEQDVELDVQIKPYKEIFTFAKERNAATLVYAPSRTNYALSSIFTGKKITLPNDITSVLKARKNEVEIENLRKANEKEAVAFTKLMKWLQTYSLDKDINEYDVEKRLIEIRQGLEGYLDVAFNPICAYGASGALAHYRATPETARAVDRVGFLLVDAGSYFMEGTTDITRTFAVGELTEEMKVSYTAVLKGHIALATVKFIKGTYGYQLDAFARRPLWEIGLSYGHGTGHGIGHMLNVHEGPLNISPKPIEEPLEVGMLISNEPAVYFEGEYGVRLENAILVQEYMTTDAGAFLEFETVSFIPFDRNAIIVDLLTEKERNWLNEYHKTVYDKVSVHLCQAGKDWLKKITAEL